MDDLAGMLFQISMLPGIRSNKSGMDATRTVAFVLAQAELDSKPLDIAEAVMVRVEACLDVLAAGAEARVAEASRSLKSQVEAVIKGTVESLQQAARGVSDSSAKLTESTMRYRDALAGPAPGAPRGEPRLMQLAPRLRA